MSEYNVDAIKDITIDTNNVIIKHNNESDFLTFTCKNCSMELGVFIGVENLVLLNKIVERHQCPIAAQSN